MTKYQALKEEIQNTKKNNSERTKLLETLLSLRSKCKRQKEFSKTEREAIYKAITFYLDREDMLQKMTNYELFKNKHAHHTNDWINGYEIFYKKCKDKSCHCQKMQDDYGYLKL